VQSTSGFFGPPAGFPPAVAEAVQGVDGVESAVGFGFARTELTVDGDDFSQFISSVDPEASRGVLEPRMGEGFGPSALYDLQDDGVIVDVGEAADHGIHVGDRLTMTGPTGTSADLEVTAISDEENLLGYYTITRATFLANQHLPGDFMVFGRSEPGSDLDDVMARIEQAIEEVPTLEVVDRDGFIGNIADQITQFVTFIYALLALSVLIAAIGIANTLSLAIHERTRELGLLRAVGMNRSQLRSSIRWEAILIALLGTVVGIVLAVVISRSLLQALHSSGLITYRIPVGSLVLLAVMAGVVGVLASFFPSRRAARMAILDAIAKS
jgi:putative ABC transport system permease protein